MHTKLSVGAVERPGTRGHRTWSSATSRRSRLIGYKWPTSPTCDLVGFLDIAVSHDAYSHRIVGWSMATTLATQLGVDSRML
jgi:hypothetical protein